MCLWITQNSIATGIDGHPLRRPPDTQAAIDDAMRGLVLVAQATDHRAPRAARDRARDLGRDRLRDFLAAGLERRVGSRLTDAELRIYRTLRARGLDHPSLAVCLGTTLRHDVDRVALGCGAVFRPARKAQAARCPKCHDSPIEPDTAAWREAGFIRVGSLDDADSRRVQYHRVCVGCGGDFLAVRTDQRHCKPACRVRARRQRESETNRR